MRTSYSALDTYQTCPLKYKFQEIDKIKVPKSKEAIFGTIIHSTMKFIHTPNLLFSSLEQALDYFSKLWNSDVFESEQEERAAFSQGVAIIQNYYRKNNPKDFNIVDLESRFQIEIGKDDNKHVVSGIIDRIDKTEDGYEIIDYKTTKKMPAQEKVDNDIQLSIYLHAFLKRYPKEIDNLSNIKVSLYYLKHGVKLTAMRTKEHLKESEQLLLDTIKTMESGKFEPIISPLCDWCGYQKYCPMWKHKFKEEGKMDSQEIKSAIDGYIEAKARELKIKKEIEELQEKISEYMDLEDVDRVFGEQGVIARILRKTYKYDKKKIKEVLEPLDRWEDVLKIDGIALKNILDVLPFQARKEIEAAKIIDKESKSFSVKKNK